MEITKLLLAHNADIDQRDNKGHSAFYEACYRNYLPLAQFLHDRGCDWKTADNGKSPLKACLEKEFRKPMKTIGFLRSIGAE